MMKAYLTGLSLELWNIVCIGFDDPEDFENLTPRDRRNIKRNAQATSLLLSALSAQEYNRVNGLEIAKEIWGTLLIAHEGVDKVKNSKINILMAKLNRFTIFDEEGPHKMFDRLMVIVGKIRGLGGDELDDHYVVKVMLEAFAPRKPTLVTLIREKKRFEEFSPNDVLGRTLTHELMDKEIQHRKKIGELEAKLNNLKVKEVSLHSNKSRKPTTSSKHTTSSKPSKTKSKKVEVDSSTSDSSEDEDEGSHVEIGDMALFMKTYKRGLKNQGYKFSKRKFPNKKRGLATIVEAPNTSLRIDPMRREKTRMTMEKKVTRKIKKHITREEIIVEKLILVMNGIPEMRALVKEKGRRLQPWLSRSFPPPQDCSAT
jgi:hypothetical protein